jgi:pimeloyl-ACP methyl ester carboxylesterase
LYIESRNGQPFSTLRQEHLNFPVNILSNLMTTQRSHKIAFWRSLLAIVALLACAKSSRAQRVNNAKHGHPSNSLSITEFYDVARPLAPGRAGELIRSERSNQYSLPYELSALRILYHSRTSRDEDVAVSGVVIIPDGKPPAGGWPVIAWAHDFKGMARQCAPSLMRNLGIGPLLAMYANLGYAVVATDYAGLGSDSGASVVDMRSNALDVTYAAAAARSAVKEIGNKWIAVGAFQGALATIALAESDLRDANFLGSVATSGLADAQVAYGGPVPSAGAARTPATQASIMLLAVAESVKALHPDFQLSDMLKESAIAAYQRAAKTCGAEDRDLTVEMLKPGWQSEKHVKQFMDDNSVDRRPTRVPILIIAGEQEQAVTADMTTKTVARMCQQGDRILFLKYPNLDASGAIGASAADQISWIKARFAGDAAPGNCR